VPFLSLNGEERADEGMPSSYGIWDSLLRAFDKMMV
jgi:hypothetical protein